MKKRLIIISLIVASMVFMACGKETETKSKEDIKEENTEAMEEKTEENTSNTTDKAEELAENVVDSIVPDDPLTWPDDMVVKISDEELEDQLRGHLYTIVENGELVDADTIPREGDITYGMLKNVGSLSINDNIKDFSSFKYLTGLSTIELGSEYSGVDSTELLKYIPNKDKVKKLVIYDCPIENLEEIKEFNNIEILELHECNELKDILSINNFPKLSELTLDTCEGLTHGRYTFFDSNPYEYEYEDTVFVDGISTINELTNLHYLEIRNCPDIRDLPDMSNLTQLEELEIMSCDDFMDITHISDLVNLKKLRISDCKKLNNLIPITQLYNLDVLSLDVGGKYHFSNFPTRMGEEKNEYSGTSRITYKIAEDEETTETFDNLTVQEYLQKLYEAYP